MSTDTFTARLYGPATSVGRELWNACANPDGAADPHPFTRYEFFEAAEESGSAVARTGWRPCHMAVERGGKTLGLMPLYLKSHMFSTRPGPMRSSARAAPIIPNCKSACRSRR